MQNHEQDVLNAMEDRIVSVDVTPDGTVTVGRLPIPTVDEVLAKIEAEWTKERFCQSNLATNGDGVPVGFYSPTAQRFCGLGIISYYTYDHRGFDDVGILVDEDGKYIFDKEYTYRYANVLNTELESEYRAINSVYYEVVRRVEEELSCDDIPSANDRPRGHFLVMSAVKRARKKLADEQAKAEVSQ